jgi:hypothetical protein
MKCIVKIRKVSELSDAFRIRNGLKKWMLYRYFFSVFFYNVPVARPLIFQTCLFVVSHAVVRSHP